MIKKIFFDITKLCNARCIYCFTKSTNSINIQKYELTGAEIFKLIDELKDLGIGGISIGGGEPFLRDIVTIGNYAKNKIDVSITSNGTILTNEILEFIRNSNVKLTISLDTMDEQISNKVRTGVNLKRVIENIKTLSKHPEILTRLSIRCVVSAFNYNHVFDVINFCNKQHIQNLKINSTNYFGRAKENPESIAPLDYFVALLDDIKDYCKKENIDTNVELPIAKYLTSSNSCLCGNTSLYIDSVGNIFPCAFTEGELVFGNLKKSSLRNVVELHKNFNHSNSLCNNCPINRYKDYNKDFSKLAVSNI